MKATAENVIIETNAKSKGDDIIEGGIIVGRHEHGEIPLYGKVVSVGDGVVGIKEGDKVLIPVGGRMNNVPVDKPQKNQQFAVTHYKNIQVVY